MTLIYNIFIRLYYFAIWLAAFFNDKASLWIKGRQSVFAQLDAHSFSTGGPRIWMHVASLGEFEQGRPVLERIKKLYPESQIILTFFSPSGYEIRKDYPLADIVCYLPLDTRRNARRFIRMVQPELVIFVKYEFWHHYLTTLQQVGIPTLLISAIFRKGHIFFKPYGKLFRRMINCFDAVFVQNEASGQLLSPIYRREIIVAGDTRIDRVMAIATQNKSFPQVAAFAASHQVLVAGSSWPADEALIAQLIREPEWANWKLMLAPHQVDEAHLRGIEGHFEGVVRYTRATPQQIREARVLLIDTIGMLSALYAYGQIAYIGGGFGQGIHNTLEPIAFGLPVIFGPKYQKFEEAVQLVGQKGAFSISNTRELKGVFGRLQQPSAYTQASEAVREFLHRHRGATDEVVKYITAKLESNNKEKQPLINQ